MVFACVRLRAQPNVWQPSPGHTQVAIWLGAIPDAQPLPEPEYVTNVTTPSGIKWVCECNVSQPTMTVYSPKGTNTGVAGNGFSRGRSRDVGVGFVGAGKCEWPNSNRI